MAGSFQIRQQTENKIRKGNKKNLWKAKQTKPKQNSLIEFKLVPVEQTSFCSAVGIYSIIIVVQNPETHRLCISVKKGMKAKKKMPGWTLFKSKYSRLHWTDKLIQAIPISYLYINV